MHRADARLDAMFAAADTNKDGKLTKDELANFIWKRFAKPDAQSVTKEELKTFAKQRIAALRAERPSGHRHKPHGGASKSESKPGAAKPKQAPASGPSGSQPKAEPKAEAQPAAGPPTAATQTSPSSKPAGPVQPAASKSGQVNAPINQPPGVSKAEAGQPAAPTRTGSKIGTSTTSGDVKAALFAARR